MFTIYDMDKVYGVVMEGRGQTDEERKHACATPTSVAGCVALGVTCLPVLLDLDSSPSLLSQLPPLLHVVS